MDYPFNPLLGNQLLPVDIVLAPEWWHRNTGLTFDEDFFFHPHRRIEAEQMMEKTLYEKWGQFGLGQNKPEKRPEIGAVHLAAGFLLSEMAGCKVNYSGSHPPQVMVANRETPGLNKDDVFNAPAFKKFLNLTEALKSKYGYLTGDVNWGGILNLAMDIRGESIFTDMMLSPEEVKHFFEQIAAVIDKFTSVIATHTGTSSISVNRVVRHLKKPVFLHSECSHTMISAEDYENYLMHFDIEWSRMRPFGIHYCGPDPHRMAASFAKIPHLDFLDVGWGGDVAMLRRHLPDTFLNIRLSPVELIGMTTIEIENTIKKLVTDSENPYLTGVCCINIDDQVADDKISAIFKSVLELRKEYATK
ncbi:MAG: hypothetical protein JXB00_06530 [Bacteroidales bacterium]|nr:hypothetical protein [Bacteroidales bacterium]